MYECTVDQEQWTELLAGSRRTLLYAAGACSGRRADAACVLFRWLHFSVWNDVMRHLKSV